MARTDDHNDDYDARCPSRYHNDPTRGMALEYGPHYKYQCSNDIRRYTVDPDNYNYNYTYCSAFTPDGPCTFGDHDESCRKYNDDDLARSSTSDVPSTGSPAHCDNLCPVDFDHEHIPGAVWPEPSIITRNNALYDLLRAEIENNDE